MAIPLYTLPEGEEYEQYIHPDPNAFDGYSYGGPPWKKMAFVEKLACVLGIILLLGFMGLVINFCTKLYQ